MCVVQGPVASNEEQPMETSSNGTAEKPAAAGTGEKPSEGAEKKTEESATGEDGDNVGEDGRPRQRILTDQGMLLPAG